MRRKIALIETIRLMEKQEFQINYADNMYEALSEHKYMSVPLGPKEFIHKSIFPQIVPFNYCE